MAELLLVQENPNNIVGLSEAQPGENRTHICVDLDPAEAKALLAQLAETGVALQTLFGGSLLARLDTEGVVEVVYNTNDNPFGATNASLIGSRCTARVREILAHIGA